MQSDNHQTSEQLQYLLQQRVAKLSEEAVKSGIVSEQDLASLKQLEQLVQINKATEPTRIRSRWPVVALLAITLIIVSLLLFTRVSSTEVELELKVSKVSFRIPEQQVLTNDIILSSIGISGIREIQMPRSQSADEQVFQALAEPGLALKLTPGARDGQSGSVTLASVVVPPGARINISSTGKSAQHSLSIKGTAMELSAGVSGMLEIVRAGTAPETVSYTSPRSIVLRSGPSEIVLDMATLPDDRPIFSRQIPADSLSLFDVDEYVSGNSTIVRHLSTVQSGVIYFESLGGAEKKLRPGQEIRFRSATGIIRTLEPKDGHVAFAFHGVVRGMTTGGDSNPLSLMPTWLEWLSARHGFSLLWGTTIYIFGLILGVMRWWKTPL